MEAQACGVPVIVTDATAMTELCGAGWKVGFEPQWHDSQGAWAAVPRIGEIADAYEQAYEKARDDAVRARAWEFAQDYDADVVAEKYWRPMLAAFETGLENRRADILQRRANRPKLAGKIREGDGLLWIDRGDAYGDVLGPADHEADFKPVLEGLLPDGGVFLDVGAHVGHWSLRLAHKASKVVAVEANPETASTLRRNIAINDISNIDVVVLAAWDEPARLNLWDPSGQQAGGSTRVLPGDDGTVRAGRLDEELTLNRLDLVKLDVEGADIHALKGMAGLLEKHRPVLFVECHDVYGYYERADLEQTLTDLGYGFEVAKSEWTAWQPDGESDELRQCDWLICRPKSM
jgi:FkbM family methyltransferase